MCKICKSDTAAIFILCERKVKLGRVFNLFLPKHIIMHNLYSMCILSVLSVGYIYNVKAYPTGEAECGIIGRRKPRIINGTVAQIGQFPWIASIKRNGVHICGGTIISGRWVVSAAHCFDEQYNQFNWTVTLGEYNKAVDEEFSASYDISNVIKHEKYNNSTTRRMLINDIVLLELSENIKWTRQIQPICLPTEDVQRSNSAIAAGWGAYNENSKDERNNKLRFVEMDILDNKECNHLYKNNNSPISLEETEMCAGKLDQVKDTNCGDSGGPLSVNVERRAVLVGITSQSIKQSIFPRPPGIYIRVFQYMDWIMSKIHQVTYYYPPVLTNNL